MKDEQILKQIKEDYGPVKSSIMRDFKTGKYIVHVMKSYSGGKGLGFMGAITVLNIQFDNLKSAERLNQKIRNMNK